jgi:hypothetical protein
MQFPREPLQQASDRFGKSPRETGARSLNRYATLPTPATNLSSGLISICTGSWRAPATKPEIKSLSRGGIRVHETAGRARRLPRAALWFCSGGGSVRTCHVELEPGEVGTPGLAGSLAKSGCVVGVLR